MFINYHQRHCLLKELYCLHVMNKQVEVNFKVIPITNIVPFCRMFLEIYFCVMLLCCLIELSCIAIKTKEIKKERVSLHFKQFHLPCLLCLCGFKAYRGVEQWFGLFIEPSYPSGPYLKPENNCMPCDLTSL